MSEAPTPAAAGRTPSLAARLVLSSIFWSGLIFVVAGVILTALYSRAAERAFDERLQVYLTALVSEMAAPAQSEPRENLGPGDPRFDWPLSGWYWQITRAGQPQAEVRASRSLYGSQLTLPPAAAAGRDTLPDGGRAGYLNGPDDRRHRFVSRTIDFGDEGRFDITVAGPVDDIEAEKREFALYLTLTFALLGLALAGSALLQVRFGLAPLARLRRAVEDVRHGEAERIGGDYPADVAPLAAELNLLIDANRKILDRARTQVGNLAHALKTPLSVIINEAERAAREPDAADLPRVVRDQAGVMRAQINWYLDRARAAALTGALGAVTAVEPVIQGLARALGRIHAERGLAVEVAVEPGLRFRGEAQDLQDLIGNLADNAFKWGRAHVRIAAAALPDARPGMIRIVVDDDGPGMAPDARDTALARGRRLDETTPGSGLGLSIVAELAEIYGGALELGDSPCGGLRATLVLPGGRAPGGG
ncbi:ATP-binding protein [Camelimonas abortus]|uniref:histidine kinase n=1 Tax=Camelimonas abortus TaxID=1017184 RepID=A0ABV7LGJ4_9HYPH